MNRQTPLFGAAPEQAEKFLTLYRRAILCAAADLLSKDDTVAVPFYRSKPTRANSQSARTLKIGGFSDGSFTISRSHGIRSELTLTREEAQQVVAFIQRFIQIEEAA